MGSDADCPLLAVRSEAGLEDLPERRGCGTICERIAFKISALPSLIMGIIRSTPSWLCGCDCRKAADVQKANRMKDPQEILGKIVDVVLKYKPPKKKKCPKKKKRRP
jgi:hypothetical protein